MILTKLTTCLLGLLFLLPLVVTFWAMAGTEKEAEARLQESLHAHLSEEAGMPQGPTGTMTSMRVTSHTSLPFLPLKLWAPYTHRWVGVMGLTFLGIVVALWMVCSFVPGIQAYGSYTSTPDFSSDNPDRGRIILTDDANHWHNKKE